MPNSSFQVSNFYPVEGKFAINSESLIYFYFTSVDLTGIHVDLWSDDDDGNAYRQAQDTETEDSIESSLIFTDFPTDFNLRYKITVIGKNESEYRVKVRIIY